MDKIRKQDRCMESRMAGFIYFETVHTFLPILFKSLEVVAKADQR